MSTTSQCTAPISIFGKVTKADIRLDPFPYMVVENALLEDYYAQLAEHNPSLQQVAGSDGFPNNTLFLRDTIDVIGTPGIPQIWQRIFASS